MGLLLLVVIGGGIYLYYRRKRVIRDLEERHLAQCKRCGHAVSTHARSCPNCGKFQRTRNVALDVVLCGMALYFVVIALSEITSDTDTSAPAEQEIFKTEVVENKSSYLPELNPADVYLSLEDMGFTTEKDAGSGGGNFWTSELYKDGIDYRVDISSDEIRKVQSIRGMATNAHRNPEEVKRFFKYVASSLFLHNNKNEEELNNWIDNNFNSDHAVTSVGAVTVKISAPTSTMRKIIIDADSEDGM